jgi:GT2 family glycosyltransferase
VNRATRASTAPWLLFMHDDLEVRTRDWLKRMARYLSIEGVGVVGATLLQRDGSVRHNGMRTDLASIAENVTHLGVRNELAAPHNCSAVSGACMLVRRDVFVQVGGLDERLNVRYADVDFCLAARAAGYRAVQATDVELVGGDFAAGGRDDRNRTQHGDDDARLMRTKWGDKLVERYHTSYDVHVEGTRILRLA